MNRNKKGRIVKNNPFKEKVRQSYKVKFNHYNKKTRAKLNKEPNTTDKQSLGRE